MILKNTGPSPDRYCQNICKQSGSSFYYSFRFLPSRQRQAIMALYAFCREVDDVVDECRDPILANQKLTDWRAEIKRLASGTPQHPVTCALWTAKKSFELPTEQLLEIIDGMGMDLSQNRFENFQTLQLYAYRVASVVGLLAAEIFGYQNRQTLKYAHDLGIALQLTNIIRDVGEDARRGRIYIPQDELVQFDVSEEELLRGHYSNRFSELMAFQKDRADRYFHSALSALPKADRKSQRPGLVMARVYKATLNKIAACHYPVLDQRISLPRHHKLWIACTTGLLT